MHSGVTPSLEIFVMPAAGGGSGGGGGSPIDELRLLVRSVFVRCVRAQYAELV